MAFLRDQLLRLHLSHRSPAEHDAAEEVRLYRNLLALLPYTVRVQKAVVTSKPDMTSVVLFKPSHRRPGRRLGW